MKYLLAIIFVPVFSLFENIPEIPAQPAEVV